MNREQRREAARNDRLDPRDLYACPDCNADRVLTEIAPGVYGLAVAHDQTCPTYRAIKETP